MCLKVVFLIARQALKQQNSRGFDRIHQCFQGLRRFRVAGTGDSRVQLKSEIVTVNLGGG